MGTLTGSRAYKAVVYRSRNGEWRWKVTARNGNKVANSGESYRRKCDCVRIMHKLFTWL